MLLCCLWMVGCSECKEFKQLTNFTYNVCGSYETLLWLKNGAVWLRHNSLIWKSVLNIGMTQSVALRSACYRRIGEHGTVPKPANCHHHSSNGARFSQMCWNGNYISRGYVWYKVYKRPVDLWSILKWCPRRVYFH